MWRFENLNLTELVTPINHRKLGDYLVQMGFCSKETWFLTQGFQLGFPIGYQGPVVRQSYSHNIPFMPGVGNKLVMWNKIMKEVQEGWVAGPFKEVPYSNFIQSPIGLVPKSGNKTRLIFHLSYNFTGDEEAGKSLNYFTPRELCTTRYHDLDFAVMSCLCHSGNQKCPLVLAKTNLSSTFRMLPIRNVDRKWLLFKAYDPETNELRFFIDKCLPFGASISCSHYQRFSDALKHIIEHITGRQMVVTNYCWLV